MYNLITSLFKRQFKGLSVYVGVCGTGFTCLSTGSFCHNDLHKQTCVECKRKQTKQNKTNGILVYTNLFITSKSVSGKIGILFNKIA